VPKPETVQLIRGRMGWRRHVVTPGLPGASQYPEHHTLYGAGAGSVQEVLAGLKQCLGHVAKCDYRACMGRVITTISSLLISAATVAVLFGTIAHDNLGIASNTIRADALSSAGFLFIVLAVGNVLSLLRRHR
jgi:hypothetical protein